jgi:ATP-dependent Clp protease protease subunit
MLCGEVNTSSASVIIAQLLFLEGQDSSKDIHFYINSPGGSITDGMAIYDTMNYVKCDINTICVGLAASMGAFLLACGTRGKRVALPNSEILIHQPLGGVKGQATDIKIHADWIVRSKEKINRILSVNTGQPYEKIMQDTERDNIMDAQSALNYRLVDKILEKRADDGSWNKK